MEAKDKAIELFRKYYCLENNSKTKTKVIEFETAKKCALIAVDEILLHEKNNHSVLDKITDYWQEVKQEIQKL